MPDETQHPDFYGIYLDTNVLIRGQGWPSLSILLKNLLTLSERLKIQIFLPQPVLKEAEEHWLRGIKDGISGLAAARRELQRLAKPLECDITVKHAPVAALLEEYRRSVKDTINEYRIVQIPFTNRTADEVFGFATRYLLPFAPEGKGRGFQDAVILLSVLDHLSLFDGANAIFVTADGDFKGIRPSDFLLDFDSRRLRVIESLELAVQALANRTYQQEVKNASDAVQSLATEISGFLNSRLTVDMIRGGLGTPTKLLAIEGFQVTSVQTPLPQPSNPDRYVEILIELIVPCKVLMKDVPVQGGLHALMDLMKGEKIVRSPEEQEMFVFWRGGIQATADVANTEFKNIKLKALLSQRERSG